MLHTDTFGSGPDLLVLHGTRTPPDHLEPLARALGNQHRVLLMHMPGYGKSPPAFVKPFIEGQRPLIVEALNAAGVRRVSVVGHSLGAWRAVDLALSGEVEVTHLYSLSGVAGLLSAERDIFRSMATEGASFPPEVFAQQMLAPEYIAAHPQQSAEVMSWLTRTPREVIDWELSGVAEASDLYARLSELRCPLVSRVGEHDGLRHHSERMARDAARGTLEIIAGVGHLPALEDLDETVASIRRALAL